MISKAPLPCSVHLLLSEAEDCNTAAEAGDDTVQRYEDEADHVEILHKAA